MEEAASQCRMGLVDEGLDGALALVLKAAADFDSQVARCEVRGTQVQACCRQLFVGIIWCSPPMDDVLLVSMMQLLV